MRECALRIRHTPSPADCRRWECLAYNPLPLYGIAILGVKSVHDADRSAQHLHQVFVAFRSGEQLEGYIESQSLVCGVYWRSIFIGR